MKIGRITVIVIVVLLIVSLGAAAAVGAGYIKINLNGKEVSSETAPIMQKGRVMVPLRFVSELFGAKVSWDGKKQIVKIDYDEPFADDGPLGSLMLVEDVIINDDGTWQFLEPGVCLYYTGYSYILAYYTADNLTPGPHSFQIAIKSSEGTVVKSILNTYEVGPNGYFRMYEEVPTYLPNAGKYIVELGIDGKVVSKTVIVAENPPVA
jgi:hypothetical protein